MSGTVRTNKSSAQPAGAEPETPVPADLQKALAAMPAAKVQWTDLTPIARRDFIMWIDAAKQPETRKQRIERACDMLASGKRRPCCFSVVPLDLHNALNAAQAAKKRWSTLTPAQRRDFITWIDSGARPKSRAGRLVQACAMIAAGKQRPDAHPQRV